jgi:hypothetical protein
METPSAAPKPGSSAVDTTRTQDAGPADVHTFAQRRRESLSTDHIIHRRRTASEGQGRSRERTVTQAPKRTMSENRCNAYVSRLTPSLRAISANANIRAARVPVGSGRRGSTMDTFINDQPIVLRSGSVISRRSDQEPDPPGSGQASSKSTRSIVNPDSEIMSISQEFANG